MRILPLALTSIVLAAAPAIAQNVLVATPRNLGNPVGRGVVQAMSWTMTNPVSGLSFHINVFNPSASGNLLVYLFRQTGSTSADQVTTASIPISRQWQGWVRVLNNVNLSDGTYTLVLGTDSTDASLFWAQSELGSLRTAAGVSGVRASFGLAIIPFPPSALGFLRPETAFNYALAVTTDTEFGAGLSFQTTGVPVAFAGQRYSALLPHNRATPGSYAWTTTGTLPAGLRLTGDAVTGALRVEGTIPEGAPEAFSEFGVTLTERTFGLSATAQFTLLTLNPTSAPLDVIRHLQLGVPGLPYQANIDGWGGRPPYRVTATGLPNGLSISDNGEISGVPTAESTSAVTFTVTDGARVTVTDSVPLGILNGAESLALTSGGMPRRFVTTVGADFDQALTLGNNTTGVQPLLGPLPPGLTVTPSGRLAGRVTAPGSYSFCVRGTTSIGPVTRCPFLYALDPLRATPATLAEATVGRALNVPLFSSIAGRLGAGYLYEVLNANGQPVANNVIAPGLTLNAQGNITGTPTATGTYTINVRVSDYLSYWGGGTTTTIRALGPLRVVAAPVTNRPTIASGGVITAGAFGAGATIAPGSWVEIYGSNLATATREWSGDDFQGNRAPQTLAGVRVAIGGRDAFIQRVSPGQINLQVPDGITPGVVSLVVTTPEGASEEYRVTVAAAAPGLLTPWGQFSPNTPYVYAAMTDGAIAGPANLVAGINFRGVRPGETITMYGVGFGATTPLTPAGTVPAAVAPLAAMPRFQVGGVNATVAFAGLIPGAVGLYQINLVVPQVAAGDQRLVVLPPTGAAYPGNYVLRVDR